MRRVRVIRLLVLPLGLFCLGAALKVDELPTTHSGASAFSARVDADARADIVIVDGSILTAHFGAGAPEPFKIRLPEGVSAIDIVPLETPGENILVAVSGRRVLRYNLPPAEGQGMPVTIVERSNRLESPSATPFPFVLGVPYEGRNVLALPRENALELWSFTGKKLASYPAAGSGEHELFSASATVQEGGIAFQISSVAAQSPDFPTDTAVNEYPHEFKQPQGNVMRAADALHQSPVIWPWFPLQPDVPDSARVLYAIAEPGDTVVRMRAHGGTENEGDLASYASPKRKYPGAPLFARERLPDFNGDGYTDLLLWKSPLPGTSVDSLARTINGGTWQVRITAHLYSQERGLYEPQPGGKIETRVPIPWFVHREAGAPLRNLVLADLNGDGYDDVAFTPTARTFCIWLYENGFRADPDYSATLNSKISRVELVTEPGANDMRAVLLRGESAFYLLSIP